MHSERGRIMSHMIKLLQADDRSRFLALQLTSSMSPVMKATGPARHQYYSNLFRNLTYVLLVAYQIHLYIPKMARSAPMLLKNLVRQK